MYLQMSIGTDRDLRLSAWTTLLKWTSGVITQAPGVINCKIEIGTAALPSAFEYRQRTGDLALVCVCCQHVMLHHIFPTATANGPRP